MAGFFIRPKSANLDKANNHINAETILPAQDGVDNEYIPVTGFVSGTDGNSVAEHRRDPLRSGPTASAPLPSGSWKGAVSRSTPSGFGKGTRAGKAGTKRG